jgi:purine-binding chemotaxis protein CheW
MTFSADRSTSLFLVVRLLDKFYGIAAELVREVVRLPEIAPVEEFPPHWIGMINVRGRVVPVMDLHMRMLRQPVPYLLSDFVVLIECGDRLFGIVVSDVDDVHPLHARALQPIPVHDERMKRLEQLFAIGIIHVDDRMVVILDACRLPGNEGAPDSGDINPADLLYERRREFLAHCTDQERALLRTRAHRLMKPMDIDIGSRHGSSWQAVTVVRIHRELFAINLYAVHGFVRVRQLTPVPCCPPHVVGWMNLRGDVVTLIDVAFLLAIPTLPDRVVLPVAQALLVHLHHRPVGILVHEVLDTLFLAPGEVTPVVTGADHSSCEYTRGAISYRDTVIPLLDMERLCATPALLVEETA